MRYIGVIIALLIFLGIFFRIYNISYSNFQGDEAKVIQTSSKTNLRDLRWELARQFKGPGQYLIVYFTQKYIITKEIQEFQNIEGLYRLPFAFASVLSFLVFTFFLIKNFTKKESILILAMFVCSGLLIALSRIVQYQSFILLFTSIALVIFSYIINNPNNKLLILLGINLGIGFLFHFDILSIALPILFYYVLNKKYRELIILFASFIMLPSIWLLLIIKILDINSIIVYLLYSRVAGEYNFDSVYYSLLLLQIYHSLYYVGFIILSVLIFIFNRLKIYGLINLLIFVAWVVCLITRVLETEHNIALIIINLFISIILLINLIRLVGLKDIKTFILFYFVFTFVFYITVMTKPLTHIYTAVIPAVILAGLNLDTIKRQFILYGILGLILVSSLLYNYFAFIDHSLEYPWENKSYIFGRMDNRIAEGSNIDGIFGFPYNRDFYKINTELENLSRRTGATTYASNEKEKITSFYIKNLSINDKDPDIYLYIAKPQSLDKVNPPDAPVMISTNNYKIYYLRK